MARCLQGIKSTLIQTLVQDMPREVARSPLPQEPSFVTQRSTQQDLQDPRCIRPSTVLRARAVVDLAPHFTDEETEAQGDDLPKVTQLGSRRAGI